MEHHYIYKSNAFQLISLKERKKEKNVVNLVLFTQKQETRSTYLIVVNNVEWLEIFTSEQRSSWSVFSYNYLEVRSVIVYQN